MVGSTMTYAPESVSAPGRSLRRALDAIDMSQTQLASRLGKSEKFVSEIINGKAPITPETAIHLERVLGTPASYWNNREAAYREWLARQQEDAALAEQADWARCFPLKNMIELGWISKGATHAAQAGGLLEFFGIATPKEWAALWGRLPSVAFRQSKSYAVDTNALSAWLRYGEVAAQALECKDFDKQRFESMMAEARAMTTQSPEMFQDRLIELCAEAGVALVFTPDLPGTRVSAATRWLSPRKALIQLGLRYGTDDHLWFSFFHECVHVLRHGKKILFLETDGLSDDLEIEADRVAGDLLIPPPEYKKFIVSRPLSKARIVAFARDVGVSPGIVVGRLQHDQLLPYSDCNGLKQRLVWAKAEVTS